MNTHVPADRIRESNDAPLQEQGSHVLYWMVSARRTRDNFALQRALRWASDLGKPLIVFEAVRCDYRWASDRLHSFILNGMRDNAHTFAEYGIRYIPYVEPAPKAGQGALRALTKQAAIVVTDEFPCFFIPGMVNAVSRTLPVRVEVVDSTGVLPLASSPRVFTTAASFRRHAQKILLRHLSEMPEEQPLDSMTYQGLAPVPDDYTDRWYQGDGTQGHESIAQRIGRLPIDHSVESVGQQGGEVDAQRRATQFVSQGLSQYHEDRNRPDRQGTSRLSAHLHFGHVSSHTLVRGILETESWRPSHTPERATGSRAGWWGLSECAEAFLDQIITWRELGYTFCHHRPHDYDQLESLPEWAQTTLNLHAQDERPYVYSLDQLERAHTHDPIWNAAQRQLLGEGYIHNYLRMLWGKKILEWSKTPHDALRVLIELNNKYALDGRNPNSWSGIFWTLGRFDRAWGPERKIFGKIRYMSSDNTARKLKLKEYLNRWSGVQLSSPTQTDLPLQSLPTL